MLSAYIFLKIAGNWYGSEHLPARGGPASVSYYVMTS